MPGSIKLKAERVIISKLLISMMRAIAATYMRSEKFGVVADEILICCAVAIGHFTSRPMTAAKVAIFVGIPRATVIRKLSLLESRGFVVRGPGGTFTQPKEITNEIPVLDLVRTLQRHIHKAATELSRLDT